MVAMVGVLLLSLLGLSQGDMDPGVAAQTTIRQGISSGFDADNIIFMKRDVAGVMNGEPPLTREMVCAQITDQHNVQNAVFLGGATVDFYECLRALYAKERYTTAGALNAWGHLHCGYWTTTDPAPATTMVDNLMWTTALSGIYHQEVTYSNRGSPCCGFIEAGPTVSSLLRQCSGSYNFVTLLHRYQLEGTIQRIQLTGKVTRGHLWDTLSYLQLPLVPNAL